MNVFHSIRDRTLRRKRSKLRAGNDLTSDNSPGRVSSTLVDFGYNNPVDITNPEEDATLANKSSPLKGIGFLDSIRRMKTTRARRRAISALSPKQADDARVTDMCSTTVCTTTIPATNAVETMPDDGCEDEPSKHIQSTRPLTSAFEAKMSPAKIRAHSCEQYTSEGGVEHTSTLWEQVANKGAHGVAKYYVNRKTNGIAFASSEEEKQTSVDGTDFASQRTSSLVPEDSNSCHSPSIGDSTRSHSTQDKACYQSAISGSTQCSLASSLSIADVQAASTWLDLDESARKLQLIFKNASTEWASVVQSENIPGEVLPLGEPSDLFQGIDCPHVASVCVPDRSCLDDIQEASRDAVTPDTGTDETGQPKFASNHGDVPLDSPLSSLSSSSGSMFSSISSLHLPDPSVDTARFSSQSSFGLAEIFRERLESTLNRANSVTGSTTSSSLSEALSSTAQIGESAAAGILAEQLTTLSPIEAAQDQATTPESTCCHEDVAELVPDNGPYRSMKRRPQQKNVFVEYSYKYNTMSDRPRVPRGATIDCDLVLRRISDSRRLWGSQRLDIRPPVRRTYVSTTSNEEYL